MNSEKLKEILELHKKYLNKEVGGVKANLRGADLRGVNLYGVDLRGVNLYEADLRGANLYEADLRGADLSRVNLRGVGLCGADLRGTKGIEQFIFARAIGSRKDETQWDMKVDIVFCGCFRGTLKEFEARVETTHKDNPVYLAEYRAMIRFFRAIRDARVDELKKLEG